MDKIVTAPAVIKITNIASEAKVFAPYKENFTTKLAAGAVVELEVKTSGQVLYYLAQANKNLRVEVLSEFDETVGAIKIHAEETITLANSGVFDIRFIPYKENFEYVVKAGDSVSLTTKHCGQVLYYLAQSSTGLTVSHEAIEE